MKTLFVTRGANLPLFPGEADFISEAKPGLGNPVRENALRFPLTHPSPRGRGLCSVLAFLVASCTVGPDYVRPQAENQEIFKEAQGWRQAKPNDNVIRGKWWEMFNDPELNKLEEQINITNQNVIQAEAQYRQAKALVVEAEATYFPTVTGSVGMTRSALGGGVGGSASNASFSPVNNQYSASLGASWEPDLWGRIRRTVEENRAQAQASFAEIASARLSAQETLAIDYLSLRIADEQERLLDTTVKDYSKALTMTDNLYKSGVDARSDYLQAKAQLEAAQAQEIDVGVARAQYEHAIAILVGKAPGNFSIAKLNDVPALPAIPLGVPSQLLERRPDIAIAERQMAAANAAIGIAKAAYYPDLTLSASGGYQSNNLAQWFSLPNRIWSLGPSLVETIFDAGLRQAQVRAATANYDATVAAYRQTVLGAFQSVEDNLAGLRILEQEEGLQDSAVKDATTATNVFINQYKSGLVSYLSVVTAQNTELSDKLTGLNIHKERLVDAATLVANLGGGWQEPKDWKPSPKPPAPTPTPAPKPTPMPTPSAPSPTPVPKPLLQLLSSPVPTQTPTPPQKQ